MNKIHREEDRPSVVYINLLTKRRWELFHLFNFRNCEVLASPSTIEISCILPYVHRPDQHSFNWIVSHQMSVGTYVEQNVLITDGMTVHVRCTWMTCKLWHYHRALLLVVIWLLYNKHTRRITYIRVHQLIGRDHLWNSKCVLFWEWFQRVQTFSANLLVTLHTQGDPIVLFSNGQSYGLLAFFQALFSHNTCGCGMCKEYYQTLLFPGCVDHSY